MAALTSLTPSNLEAIDISHYQNTVDFAQVKNAGISVVHAKATQGGGTYNTTTKANAGYQDPNFKTYVTGCWNVGLPVGAYHFATPTAPYNAQEAINQADWFVDTVMGVMGYMGDVFPVLDIESPTSTGVLTPDELLNWCVAWLNQFNARTSRQAMIYTGTWFIQQNANFVKADGTHPLSSYPLWIAEYAASPTAITEDGWANYTMWQYTDQGSVAGVSGNVDRSKMPSDICYLMPPKQITGFTATAGDGQITLSWNPSTEADVGGYDIWHTDGTYVKWVNGGSTNSTTLTGLTNGTSYSYYIQAVDSYEKSKKSSTITATPAVPTTTGGSTGGGPVQTVTPTTTVPNNDITYTSYIPNDSPVQIIIGHNDYTPLISYDTVQVDNNIIMTSDTMTCEIQLNPDVDMVKNAVTGAVALAKRPKCGNEIMFQNPKLMVTAPNGTRQPYREFAGVVVSVSEDTFGMDLVYQIETKAYVHWLDRHLVTNWYAEDAPEQIIKRIVNGYSKGFSTYNVQPTNVTVIPQYFDYQKVSDSIKLIADQLEYGWYVDYYKDVHFYAAEAFQSPLPNNILNVDTDVQNYGDLIIEENGQQQYNKIFLKGFKTRSADHMVITYNGDGQTTQWSLGYRVSSVVKPTPDVSVRVYASQADYNADAANFYNGAPTRGTQMTLKRDIVDGAPSQGASANTAYIHYTQHLLRIPNLTGGTAIPNNGGNAVPTGYVIAVRFHYMKDMVFLAQDPSAQSDTRNIEGTDGVYEYAATDKSLTNSTLDAVKAKGQLLLMKYKKPQITGTFNTFFYNGSAVGWRAGQYFRLITKRRFGGLDKTMFVQRVTKKIVENSSGVLVTQYTVEFADSPYLV